MILGERLSILCLAGDLVDDSNKQGSFLSNFDLLRDILDPSNPLGECFLGSLCFSTC